MVEYLPDLGRPKGRIGPVGLWKYVDREGQLDLNLTVVRCRALRTYHPTSRDQHWSLSWVLGQTSDGHQVHRRIHIVRERGFDHLTNWGPITVAVGNITTEDGIVIHVARINLEQRQAIEEIAKRTPVRKPDGEWNCQDWLETVMEEAVGRGILQGEAVQVALRRAREVRPIPFYG